MIDAPLEKSKTLYFAVVVLFVVLIIYGLSVAMQIGSPLIVDEEQVYLQAKAFVEHRFELVLCRDMAGDVHPLVSVLPGYQVVLAIIATITQCSSTTAMRLYAFGFSLLYLWVAYGIARCFFPRDIAILRAIQAYLLPIIFPLHFLMYTDVFALLMILSAFWTYLHGHYRLSSVLAVVSILARQTNAIFILFLLAYAYIDQYGLRITSGNVMAHIKKSWLLILGLIAFAVFVLVHGRVNLDNPSYHPVGFYTGNLAFSLVFAGIVFAPLFVDRSPHILSWVRSHGLAAGIVGCVSLAVAATFVPSSEVEQLALLWRNYLITVLTSDWIWRMVLATIIVGVALSVAVTPLVNRSAAIIYPYWFCLLASARLIEPRYYAPAFVLFLLLRKTTKAELEVALCLWFAVLVALLRVGYNAGYQML